MLSETATHKTAVAMAALVALVAAGLVAFFAVHGALWLAGVMAIFLAGFAWVNIRVLLTKTGGPTA